MERELMLDTTCPWCGTSNDSHSSLTPGHVPQTGDISICTGCLGMGVYIRTAGGLRVRRANRAEQEAVARQRPDIAVAVEALVQNDGRPVEDAVAEWRSRAEEPEEGIDRCPD